MSPRPPPPLSCLAGSSQPGAKRVPGIVCPAALQVIIQKLSEVEQYKAAVLQYADQIMETLLRVFASRGGSSVHEEAMLAVGAFTYACGRQFSKYLPAFYPYLKAGLMNHQEWQVGGSSRGGWALQLGGVAAACAAGLDAHSCVCAVELPACL